MRELLVVVLATSLFGCGSASNSKGNSGSPAGNALTNVIVLENEKPGDPTWRISDPNPRTQTLIEGFASATSVNRGGTISFFVNTVAPTYDIDIFRLGWYSGVGARRLMPTITRNGTSQPIPSPDPQFGIVEAIWTDPFVLSVPKDSSDPTDWPSGVYLAKLSAAVPGGFVASYIIFVVRDDSRGSDLLFQSSTNTFEAYNGWGGRSLYSHPRAFKVSYNRPYATGFGAGQFFRFEYNMLRFLEREGYDVTYATDVDAHENPSLALAHKGFLIVGHDEYWSSKMFDHLEAARNAGVSLGFFSADDGFWQVRFESSTADGQPDRTIVCYKLDAPALDPDAANPAIANLTTTAFRLPPVNRPEDTIIGEMSDDSVGTNVEGDILVTDAGDPVFQGTGLQNGTTLPGLVGNEIDRVFGALPANETILAHSPVVDAVTHLSSFSDVTISNFPSGAIVFAAGTFQWSWGLDDDNFFSLHPVVTNPAAQQTTRNILKQFGATH